MKILSIIFLLIPSVQCTQAPAPLTVTQDESAIAPPSTVVLCDQEWAVRNLDVATYRNGDVIPQVNDREAWLALTTGAWCWYANDSATYAATYGRLYNWYAVNDPRGLAPEGWHVPSDGEWQAMEACVSKLGAVGQKLKEAGPKHWSGGNAMADNGSGFAGLPGGQRSDGGEFSRIGQSAVFWTSVEGSIGEAWCQRVVQEMDATGVGYVSKTDGNSVRCLRDR